MSRNAKTRLALASLVCMLSAQAELADRNQPVNIDAGFAERNERTGLTRLGKGVVIVQGSLVIRADEGTVQSLNEGGEIIQMAGRPVTFKQKIEGKAAYTEGRAAQVHYDSRSGDLKLIGNAWIRQDQSEAEGERLTYNANTETYRAEPGTDSPDGRVRLILQPRPRPTSVTPTTP
jgi:lipopolysaccharide export system protein LptA